MPCLCCYAATAAATATAATAAAAAAAAGVSPESLGIPKRRGGEIWPKKKAAALAEQHDQGGLYVSIPASLDSRSPHRGSGFGWCTRSFAPFISLLSYAIYGRHHMQIEEKKHAQTTLRFSFCCCSFPKNSYSHPNFVDRSSLGTCVIRGV